MTSGEIALWALNQQLTEQDRYNARNLINAYANAEDGNELQSIIEAWCFKIRVEGGKNVLAQVPKQFVA